MGLDLILRRGRVRGRDELLDIGIAAGRIAALEPNLAGEAAAEEDLGGRLVTAGFVESHIHLDKSCILERYVAREGTLAEAIARVRELKAAFTEEDIYARARRTLEQAIGHGTTRMRTHVEVDPAVGLRGFEAIRRLKRDYAWAIDIEICVFPQDGLTNYPGTEELLIAACEAGADLIGGCPYTDTAEFAHIERIFVLARRFDVDIDFHLDFDLEASTEMSLTTVCDFARALGRGGRVAVGHVTRLSTAGPWRLADTVKRLVEGGVAVTALPATDLFLMGRECFHSIPRGVAPVHRLAAEGVTCSLASNNVLNPFTPFGDCSLLRMANLYANVAQLGEPRQHAACFDMITSLPAKLMRLPDYGIAVGNPADVVVLDCSDAAAAVEEIAPALFGLKRGRRTFARPPAALYRPE